MFMSRGLRFVYSSETIARSMKVTLASTRESLNSLPGKRGREIFTLARPVKPAGTLDAACDVKRNGMPTTEQAVIHITF
jgi:hypothetical protein